MNGENGMPLSAALDGIVGNINRQINALVKLCEDLADQSQQLARENEELKKKLKKK